MVSLKKNSDWTFKEILTKNRYKAIYEQSEVSGLSVGSK